MLNAWLFHGMKHSPYLYGHYHIVKTIMQKELPMSLSIIMLDVKGEIVFLVNCIFGLGVKEVRDAIEARY